jgi:DNA-binding CsgD family transcriptional regulator
VGEVIGRDAELRVGADFLAVVRDGVRGLLIEGDAGIGKTTVWAELARKATDAGDLVLTTRSVASEAQLTLSALGDLLAPIGADAFEILPGPQRRALDAALLRAEPTGDAMQPRLLGTAVRTLLEHLAATQPVVVAIDDVQWMDAASAAIVAFALRRLGSAPIGLLAARRSGIATPFDIAESVGAERLTRIEIRPLTMAALHFVLKERLGRSTSRSTLVRVHQASGGNPLFAIEIARLLEEIGEPASGDPLPVPDDVRDLLRLRIAQLPESTRLVLVAVAILGRASLEILSAVFGSTADDDVHTAEAQGLVRREGASVTFAHPLYASAMLADAALADRRAMHHRLADVLESPEERIRHRALGAAGPDPEVALDLDRVARQALARGAPLAAAELARLSIERTPVDDAAELATRRLDLAEYLKRAGESALAEAALDPVIGGLIPAARARARLTLAAIRFETDASPAVAIALCEAAISDAGDDIELLARAHATLGAVDFDDLQRASGHVAEAVRLIDQVPDPDPAVLGLILMEQCNEVIRSGGPLDPAVIERALALEARSSPASVSERFSASLGTWLKQTDDFDGARRWLEQTYRTALDEGDDGSLPYAIGHLPELEVWTGNWPRAEELAQRHLELSVELGLGSQRVQALYNLALVHVHQGRVDEARAEIEEALAAAAADHDDWMTSAVLPLAGLLELSLGSPMAAREPLLRARELRDRLGSHAPRRHDPDLVESLVASGDVDRAAESLSAMETRARAFARHSALANLGRSRALVAAARGELDASMTALDVALAEHDLADIPFDRARTLLVLGQVLRRRRERGAAKVAFEASREIFDRLGARLWTARAGQELDRLGLRRGSGLELTEAERRVVELAASGSTNRVVAATLFMSPKTVEANLARAYQKLGIRSRAELGAVMARGGLKPETPQT